MKRIDTQEVIQWFGDNPDWKLMTWEFIDYKGKRACVMGAMLMKYGMDKDMRRSPDEPGMVNALDAQLAAGKFCDSMGYAIGFENGLGSSFGTEEIFAAIMQQGFWIFKGMRNHDYFGLKEASKDIFKAVKLDEYEVGFQDAHKAWEEFKAAGLVHDNTWTKK